MHRSVSSSCEAYSRLCLFSAFLVVGVWGDCLFPSSLQTYTHLLSHSTRMHCLFLCVSQSTGHTIHIHIVMAHGMFAHPLQLCMRHCNPASGPSSSRRQPFSFLLKWLKCKEHTFTHKHREFIFCLLLKQWGVLKGEDKAIHTGKIYQC